MDSTDTKTGDFDAREFLSSNFIKKDELKRAGPQRFVIQAVEQSDGLARNGKPPKKILQLIFADGRRFGLGTNVNLRRVVEAFGTQTSGWLGKTVELYYSPDVRGPNGEEGGTRVRVPTGAAPDVPTPDFAAVLKSEPF